MQVLMLRLDAVLRRRRWVVLFVWASILALAIPLAMRQSDHLTSGGFSVPGSQSDQVDQLVKTQFPDAAKARMAAVLVISSQADRTDVQSALKRVRAAVREVPKIALQRGVERKALALAGSNKTLIVPLRVDTNEDGSQDVAGDLRSKLGLDSQSRSAPVQLHLIGEGAIWAGLESLYRKDLSRSEELGFPVILIVLLAIFGSFAAASLPLFLGAIAVLITGAIIFLLSHLLPMSVFVTNTASMIGIGVAVDYSLIVLSRYRQEIEAGREPTKARGIAMATSGVAVVFSGMTVITSLAGLWLVKNEALRSLALGAMLVVAVAVLVATTLLPVLISLYGRHAYRRNRLLRWRSRAASSLATSGQAPTGGPQGGWARWTRFIMRHSVAAIIVSAAILLTLAIPALSLHTSTGALRQLPRGNETRVGFDRAAAVTGRGASGPAVIALKWRSGTDASAGNPAALQQARRLVKADRGVVRIGNAQSARDRRSAIFTATLGADPESPAAKVTVQRLRSELAASRVASAATIAIGGSSALQQDLQDEIAGSLWKVMLFVLGLSFLVLMVLLRSVLLPLKAVLMNLLSVGAAYGVLVAVFQYGWLDGLLGIHTLGYLDTLTPPLILAIVFGLSMDYEVFLLTRIRERWEVTGDPSRAVSEGLAASARTITSAAFILVAVFSVFVATSAQSIQELGVGAACAIGLDATLVRLVLVPATMNLLGRWNWWLPRTLDRILSRGRLPFKDAVGGAAYKPGTGLGDAGSGERA